MIKSLNKFKKNTFSDKIFASVVILCMTFFALSYIFAFVWMLLGSFRSYISYNANPSSIFDFSHVEFNNLFDNYKTVFSYSASSLELVNGVRVKRVVNIFSMLKNSFIQMFIHIAGALIFPPAVGYVVAKYNFRFKKLIITSVVLTMCIPSIGTTVSVLAMYDKFKMINTWWPVILSSSGGLGFGVLLYGNYFSSIPWEFVEAAKIDGAGDLQSYIKIMFPQAVPILIAQIILAVINVWNDYMTCFLYMPKNITVAYGVSQIASEYSSNYPVVFAALLLTSAVTLILYAFFSKTIMSSMSAGGLKG